MVSSMIYRALIDHLKVMPVDVNCQAHVDAICVINPSPLMYSVDDEITLAREAAIDHTEIVLGMIPLEDMTLFARDRKGLALVRQYALKLVENVYMYASAANKHRKKMSLVTKLSTRRRLYPKFKSMMPIYAVILEKVDHKTMQKYDISEEEISKYI